MCPLGFDPNIPSDAEDKKIKGKDAEKRGTFDNDIYFMVEPLQDPRTPEPSHQITKR